jgi:hypothetical protein
MDTVIKYAILQLVSMIREIVISVIQAVLFGQSEVAGVIDSALTKLVNGIEETASSVLIIAESRC